MELNKNFADGIWSKEVNVRDFVMRNITPYDGDASFLAGPTERTKRIWSVCLAALAEERANNGVRSIDNKTVSTISSHKAGYIDKENELHADEIEKARASNRIVAEVLSVLREKVKPGLTTMELDKIAREIAKSAAKLGNAGFVERAPAEVVNQEKARLADWEAKQSQLKGMLDSLS